MVHLSPAVLGWVQWQSNPHGALQVKSRFQKASAYVETGKCLTLRRRRTLHPAEQMRLLATPRLDQPVGGVLDAGGNAGVEFLRERPGGSESSGFRHKWTIATYAQRHLEIEGAMRTDGSS
jgi:hypothetical protein